MHVLKMANRFFLQFFFVGGGTCFRGPSFYIPVGVESDGGGGSHRGRSQMRVTWKIVRRGQKYPLNAKLEQIWVF